MDRANTAAMWITVGSVVVAFGLFFVVPALTSAPAEDFPAQANPSTPTTRAASESASTSVISAHSVQLVPTAPQPVDDRSTPAGARVETVAPPAPAEEPAEEPVDEAAELLAMAVVIAEEYGKGSVDLDTLDLDAVTRTQVFTLAASILDINADLVKLAEERGVRRTYQRAFIEEATPFMVAAPLAAGILSTQGDIRGGLLIVEAMKAVNDEVRTY